MDVTDYPRPTLGNAIALQMREQRHREMKEMVKFHKKVEARF